MVRKSPIRHKVRSHIRGGKPIKSFERGSGKKSQRSSRVVGTRTISPKNYSSYHYFHGTPYENFKSIINTGLLPSESGWTYLSDDFMQAGAYGDLGATLQKSTSSEIVVFAFDIPKDMKIHQIKDQPDLRVRTDSSLRPVAYVILERDIPNRKDWMLKEFTVVSRGERRR